MRKDTRLLHEAVEALLKVKDTGWRQENVFVDTTWAIPIETLWAVEKFLEKYGVQNNEQANV